MNRDTAHVWRSRVTTSVFRQTEQKKKRGKEKIAPLLRLNRIIRLAREIPVLDAGDLIASLVEARGKRGRESRLIALAGDCDVTLVCPSRASPPPLFKTAVITISQNVLSSSRWERDSFLRAEPQRDTLHAEHASGRRARVVVVVVVLLVCVTLESRHVRLPTSCHICTVLEVRSLCSCTGMAVTYRVPDAAHAWPCAFFGSGLFSRVSLFCVRGVKFSYRSFQLCSVSFLRTRDFLFAY